MPQCFTRKVSHHTVQAVAKQDLLSVKVLNSLEEIVMVVEDSNLSHLSSCSGQLQAKSEHSYIGSSCIVLTCSYMYQPCSKISAAFCAGFLVEIYY